MKLAVPRPRRAPPPPPALPPDFQIVLKLNLSNPGDPSRLPFIILALNISSIIECYRPALPESGFVRNVNTKPVVCPRVKMKGLFWTKLRPDEVVGLGKEGPSYSGDRVSDIPT